MKRLSTLLKISAIGLASLVATQASAFPGSMMIKKLRQHAGLSASNKLMNCMNFSGSWVGQCNNSDGTVDQNQTVVISQNSCDDLTQDNDYLQIGGSNRSGSTALLDASNADTVLSLSWNSSRTVLNGLFGVTYQQASGLAFTAEGYQTMSLEDGKLHVVSNFAHQQVTGGTAINIVNQDCVYEKAP